MDFLLISRDRWGGRAAGNPMGSVREVVVHHTYRPDPPPGGSLEDEIALVRRIEAHHRQNNWGGIGYTFLVSPTGRVFEGRGWGRTGTHSPGKNSDSIGLCFMTDGTSKQPTDAAWESAELLIKLGQQLGHIGPTYTVTGHRDHRATECPGDAIYRQLHRLGPSALAAQTRMPTLRQGDRGDAVVTLQTLLDMQSQHRTGYFGPITDEAVRDFQNANGLTADGIAGPATWSKLLAD